MVNDDDTAAGADDDQMVVEALEEAGDGGQPLRGGARLRAGAAHALWGRRLSGHERLARGALVVALIAATFFALLGGPALTVVGWQRLTFALHSGTLAPQLAMTDWQRVPLPPGVAPDTLSYAVDAANPETVFACLANANGIVLWRTDSLGRSWIPVVVTQTPAQSCQVKTPLDSSQRALLVARSPDPLHAGCQRFAVYLSQVAGYQWSPVSLPGAATGATGCQGDAWASARWVFAWWTDGAAPEPSSNLMRSADGGQTWQSADGGLPARGAYLAPALTSFGSGGALLAQVYYWPRHGRLNIHRELVRSLDGGATWEAISSDPPAAVLAASLEPRIASAGAWSALYASIYTDGLLAPPWVPDQPPEAIQTLSTHTALWNELPPLPVSGATADDHLMGIAASLGVAPANVLLALGADPHTTVTESANTRDLWLWAWDPVAGEWRVGAAVAPHPQLVGFTWSAGPVGSPYEQTYGAYLWLTGDGGGHRMLYSAFIPVPSAS